MEYQSVVMFCVIRYWCKTIPDPETCFQGTFKCGGNRLILQRRNFVFINYTFNVSYSQQFVQLGSARLGYQPGLVQGNDICVGLRDYFHHFLIPNEFYLHGLIGILVADKRIEIMAEIYMHLYKKLEDIWL